MQNNINDLLNEARIEIKNNKNYNDLLSIKAKYLGKESFLHKNLMNIKNYSGEEKKKFGTLINNTKSEILSLIEEALTEAKQVNINQNFAYNDFLYIKNKKIGSIHPVTKVVDIIKEFLKNYNFTYIKSKEIDNDWNNFESLNIGKNHPARQMVDTFYLEESNLVLRTHTSNMQMRFMSSNKAPFRFYSYGRTYRKDSDKTHTPMFHQLEIVCIQEGISVANLKAFLYDFLRYLFGSNIKIRLRHSFFPFTQASFEVDIMLNDKWLEVLGSGIIHDNVLKNANIDSGKFQGFAIGMGLDRLAMIMRNINDLRSMFESNTNFISKYNYRFNQI